MGNITEQDNTNRKPLVRNTRDIGTGISNRETPDEEAAEREEFPPIKPADIGESGHALKVPGAFGRNGEPAPADQVGSSHPGRAKQESRIMGNNNTKKTNGGNQDSEPRDDQNQTNGRVDEGAAMEGVDGHDNNDHDGNRHRGNNTGADDTRRGGGNSGAGKSGSEGLGTEKSKDGLGSEKPGQR